MVNIQISEVIESLVDGGVSFVAINEPTDDIPSIHLDDGRGEQNVYKLLYPLGPVEDPVILLEELIEEADYHPHPDYISEEVPRETELCEGIITDVTLGDETFTLHMSSIEYEEIHTQQRVPIYADNEIPGIESQSLDDGLASLQATISQEEFPKSTETEMELAALVEDLAEAGAVAVEINIISSGTLHVVVPIEPLNKGHDILVPVDTVRFDGQEFDLWYDVTRFGIQGSMGTRVAVYKSEDIFGDESKSIEEGMAEFGEKLNEVLQRSV